MADINFPMLFFQLANIALLISWFVLVLRSLQRLGRVKGPDAVKLGWVALILFIPIFGALAFLNTYKRSTPSTTL